jgi:hypothetical protein
MDPDHITPGNGYDRQQLMENPDNHMHMAFIFQGNMAYRH